MSGADAWPDLAGRLMVGPDGKRRHILPVRVYFEDTDFSGVVYHASYLRWCERGRSDFMRLIGNEHRALMEGGDGAEPAAFAVRRMQLEFLKPAKIDDILEVETRVAEVRGATLSLAQQIARRGIVLFEAQVLIVLISLTGKPQRISQRLRTGLGDA